MASTPQAINVAVGNTATALYTFPGSGPTRAMLVSLDFCNTTTAPITLDVTIVNGGTTRYIGDDLVVPAKGTLTWRGMVTLVASDVLKGTGSATGVDATGTVVENA